MNPLAAPALSVLPGEFLIGAADIDARAKGVAKCGRGGPIQGFRVIAGSGALVYIDDVTGNTCTLGDVVALAVGDEITPELGIRIRTINGTGNAAPSAALSLRAIW